MKKLLAFIAFMAMVVSCQESLEEKAAREAKTYTQKNCPLKFSETMMIDSMTFDKATHTFHYYYTMMGPADTIVAVDEEQSRTVLLEQLRNSTHLKAYKDEGYRFHYLYRSQKNPQTVYIDKTFGEKDYQ